MMNLSNWKKSMPSVFQHHRNPFLALQQELDKAMSDFNTMFDMPHFSQDQFEGIEISPAVDIVDEKDTFKVEAEMPGLSEEDIKVSISDGMLTIKGEKKSSKKDQGKNYVMREISYGSYERTIALPDSADVDKAVASFRKGMLWVTIPKSAESAKKCRDLKIQKV